MVRAFPLLMANVNAVYPSQLTTFNMADDVSAITVGATAGSPHPGEESNVHPNINGVRWRLSLQMWLQSSGRHNAGSNNNHCSTPPGGKHMKYSNAV